MGGQEHVKTEHVFQMSHHVPWVATVRELIAVRVEHVLLVEMVWDNVKRHRPKIAGDVPVEHSTVPRLVVPDRNAGVREIPTPHVPVEI